MPTKKYGDLKNPPTPPDLDDDKPNDDDEGKEEEEEEENDEGGEGGEGEGEGEGGEGEGEGEGEEEEEEDETPAWAKDFKKDVTKSVGDIGDRLDKIEEGAKAPPIPPTGKPAEGEDDFKPDYEKGQYLPKGYKPKGYNEFIKKVIEAIDGKRQHTEAVQTQQENDWNKQWDTQLTQLTKEGKLPEVKDPNDPKDLGKLARAKLLINAAKAGTTDLVSFYNVTAGYKKKPKKTPPSSKAPVGKETGGDKATKGKKPYKDLKKDLEAVKAEKYPELVS